ncbi:MAG: hypothetical protein IBJ18_03330 [Phycisphaerales bacterium]|nr:hypothetical protein [Phycisphaerales bacterium]
MLDIMLTWVIMHLGGSEVNPLARAAIAAMGHWGLILIKLASIITVVAVVQILAQRNPQHARMLATIAIAIAAFPPTYALIQLAALALARTELAALMLMPHP